MRKSALEMASSRPCRGVGGWGPATGHSEGLRRTPFLLLSLNPSVRFALSRPRGRFLSVHSTRSADPADFQCPGPSPTRVWPLGGVPEFVSLRPPPLWDTRPFSCPRLPPESVPFLTPEPVTGTASVGCSRMVLSGSSPCFPCYAQTPSNVQEHIREGVASLTGLAGGR